MPMLFAGALKNWKSVLLFVVFSLVFWFLEFFYQLFLSPNAFGLSLIRSFGFAGATFIALSLLSSVFFKFFPRFARYWPVRRNLGVMGFVFVLLHVLAAFNFVFGWSAQSAYWSLNPFENPVVFGALALAVFFPVALSSSDWALLKLGGPRWKALHRLVYFGFLFAVFHFLRIAPFSLMNFSGYLLLFLSFLVLVGELYWFALIGPKRNIFSVGSLVGYIVILLYLVFAFITFF